MTNVYLLLASLCLSFNVFAFQGPSCDEDIAVINGTVANGPCVYQDPPNSGNYVFLHDAVEKIEIRGNGANIVSVSFPNLTSVEKYIRVSYNQVGGVTSASFPALRTAGSVDFVGNQGTVSVDMPMLTAIDSQGYGATLKVQSNPVLQSFSAINLHHITSREAGTAYLQMRYNPMLQTIDFPRLRSVESMDDYGEAYIFIQHNDAVQQISMNTLRALTAGADSISYLIIDDMASLTSISFPQLTELLPTGGAWDFSELTIGNSPNLANFSFPSLQRVTLLQLAYMNGEHKAMFPNLSELGYLWVYRDCSEAATTLKMYICSELPLEDLSLNDNGTCGSTGYMLYSENADNRAWCDSMPNCTSFIPDVNDCHCGAPGLCN